MTNSAFSIDMEQVGTLAADLLCGDPTWIRRRKLQVEFVDDVVARLGQSVDFCIPNEALKRVSGKDLAAAGRIVHLPLFVLRKAPQELSDFDLLDAKDAALSLPTRATNAELSMHALLARAKNVRASSLDSAEIVAQIEEIAMKPPGGGLDACERLIGRAPPDASAEPPSKDTDYLARDPGFRFLAQLLASASMVAIPVEIKPGQQLLKLSYSEPIMQWNKDWRLAMRIGVDPLPVQVDLPFLGAQTFHLEVRPPQGMAVSSGLLAMATPGGPQLLEVPSTSRSIHLYVSDVHRAQSGVGIVGLRALKPGFMETARAACAAVTAILALCIVFAGPLAEANKTMPTLLLFFPGLLATFALQPMRHALTQRVLTSVRDSTLVCAGAAFLAAFVLIVAPVQKDRSPGPWKTQPQLELSGHSKPRPATAAVGPSLLSIDGRARLTVLQEAAGAEKSSVAWLRIGWGLLCLVSLAATLLVATATRRAAP